MAGTLLGSAAGEVISFNTEGLDFALTALFVVIFTEQWLSADSHVPALTGVICSVVSLALFGADRFIIPAMLLILAAVSAGYRKNASKLQGKGITKEKGEEFNGQ